MDYGFLVGKAIWKATFHSQEEVQDKKYLLSKALLTIEHNILFLFAGVVKQEKR
jgi:hypothetical protein